MSGIYGDFYNPNRVLSYGRPYMFCVGSRSVGKSTGWALYLIDQFVKYGRQWVYCRRTKDETLLTCVSYFDSAIEIYNSYHEEKHVLEYDGGVYKLDGDVAGFVIPLSLQQKYKSANYSGVWTILYDEFLVAPGSGARYLGGREHPMQEVDAMSSLYQSVDRGIGRPARNEVRVVFCANSGTYYNPFFMAYGLDRLLRPDTKYLAPKDALFVVEMISGVEATKGINQSNAYRLSTEGTKAYAFGNKFADLMRSEEFVERSPDGDRTPMCTLVYDGSSYAVYACMDAGYLYVSHGRCNGRPVLALTLPDHRPNYLLISQYRAHYITKLIKEMYDCGCVRFADNKCKMVLDFYLGYMV